MAIAHSIVPKGLAASKLHLADSIVVLRAPLIAKGFWGIWRPAHFASSLNKSVPFGKKEKPGALPGFSIALVLFYRLSGVKVPTIVSVLFAHLDSS
jgi:hypothetical protein